VTETTLTRDPSAAAEPATPPNAAPAPAEAGFALEEIGRFAPVYPLPRLELAEGRGSRVRDVNGREYLDFTCGIAVNALGHAPPGLAGAIARQARALGHCSNLFANRPALELARALCEATAYERVFFCNSGAEAVEAALKFARAEARARGRSARDVLAFRGGFHGRTAFALASTWTPAYREPFEPLVPGVRFADFNDLGALDGVLDAGVAAVIVEPVQGEGGAVPARPDFLRALRARSEALGAVLIFDEVQSGMGRCGRLLAAEHYGVRADLTVMSKALGGGIPIGAVLMGSRTAQALEPGMHGCTFGGNPVAAAAGLWMLGRIRRPGFLERVRRRGRALEAGLGELVGRHPRVLSGERGLGLLRAVELAAGSDPRDLVASARRQGLLLVRGGERAVRVLPPLTVTPSDLAEGLERLDAALAALESRGGANEA
jgi:acetylornithine/N-succinyldiaminopimelate aminotransferase